MQLNIKKRYFYRLEGILGIKAHIEKLNDVKVDEDHISGCIEINASYTDVDGMECFKVIPYPFEIDVDDVKALDVNLGNVRILVVENQGFDIECDLVLNYMAKDNNTIYEEVIEIEPTESEEIVELESLNNEVSVEVEPINNVELEDNSNQDMDTEEIDKIKEDISKNYEDKLAESLHIRNENIISTKSHETKSNFLSFLTPKSDKKYCLKSLYVEKEDDLNTISKEYKVSISELLKGYDRNSKRVIFKID